MIRFVVPVACLALAACEPSVPDSAAGVGFQDYNRYEADRIAREQALRSQTPVTPAGRTIGDETIASVDPDIGTPPVPQPAEEPAPTPAPVVAVVEPEPAPEPVAPVPVATVEESAAPAELDPAPVETAVASNSTGISDEQDFGAVSNRESIESDAERLARQREQYQLIQPEALPERDGDSGPNIVAFALSTTNNIGEPIYRRSGFNAVARFNRACGRYTSADQAQADFLARGGPERDRLGVDPDGDGFACFWDPRPFRAARGG